MNDTLSTLLAVGALSLVPFALMATTSFVKLAIVFSVLRSALGTAQVPSGLVITALAAILSFYVMAPIASQMAQVSAPAAARVDLAAPLKGDSAEAVLDTWSAAKEPLGAFLARNAGERERELFLRLSLRQTGETAPGELRVVLPAFLITELKEAFQIGFFVLLPFLVIDLVVSNILLSLGMFMLSPTTVSLPFKLLLFVLVDGFYVLSEALIAGYA